MIDRILGHMQIANETIQVVETKLPDEALKPFFDRLDLPGKQAYQAPKATDITWYALTLDETVIAYGLLARDEETRCGTFTFIVIPPYRDVGLGKFMVRFGTDQAIRYRLKEIVVTLPQDLRIIRPRAVRMLEAEDFDLVDGQGIMRKVLKWQ